MANTRCCMFLRFAQLTFLAPRPSIFTMAANALGTLCVLFCLALCTVVTLTFDTKWPDRSQKRFVVYLTG